MKPIAITPRPSRMLLIAVAGLQLLALLLLLWLGRHGALPWPLALLLSAVLACSAAFHARRRQAHRACPLQVSAHGVLTLDYGSGWETATVLPSSVVTPFLTLIHLRRAANNQRVVWLVLPDAVDADSYRRLRVWLKWGARSV